MSDLQSKQRENSADGGFMRLLWNSREFTRWLQAGSCPSGSLFPHLKGEEIGLCACPWPFQPPRSLTLWSSCLLELHCGHRSAFPKVWCPDCLCQKEPGWLLQMQIPWPRPGLRYQNWGKGGDRQESLFLQAPQTICTLKFKNHQHTLIRTVRFYFKSPISQLFWGW